jgi:hypothetical protein
MQEAVSTYRDLVVHLGPGYGRPMEGGDNRTADHHEDVARFIQGPGEHSGIATGSPDRIRTGVSGLKGRRPRPLDDGTGLG